jgi:hypothetical protein
MKIHIKPLVLLLCGASVQVAVNAQAWVPCPATEFREQKAKSDALYAGTASIRMRIDMASYRSINDPLPFDQGTAVVMRSGEAFRSEQLGMITVQNGSLRVTIDETDRIIMVNKPAPSDEPFVSYVATTVFDGLASCAKRNTPLGNEFKLVFGEGALYDHMIVRYDAMGWLRGTETHWRQPIPEYPDDPNSAAYTPKLLMTYWVPTPLTEVGTELDPLTYVSISNGKVVGLGRYAAFQVYDGRVAQ